jgi:membrane fusion protein (multidrug efflux system)
LAALAAALTLAACGQSPDAGQGAMPGGPVPVSVLTAQAETLPVTLEYTAQTLGSREVEIRARVTGILLKRNYREGGKVTAGQSLFSIDPAPFANALARSEADVVAAEAGLPHSECIANKSA